MSIDWSTIGVNAWRVLLTGMIYGAGLPLLFSLGIRFWDVGSGGEHADGTITARKAPALALAYTLFAVVAVMVAIGVLYVTKASIKHYLGVTIF